MEHQSAEDARKWAEKLDTPLPGEAAGNDMDEDEMNQLKHL